VDFSPVSARVLAWLAVTLVVGMIVGIAPAPTQRAVHCSTRYSAEGAGAGWRSAWPSTQATSPQASSSGPAVIRSLQRAGSCPASTRPHTGCRRFRLVVTGTPAERARHADVERRALGRLQERAEVEGAAIAVGSPFGNAFGVDLFVPGFDSLPKLAGGGPYIAAVSADYFTTVGTRLLRGRAFRPGEGAGTERVTIVNETMAQTLWRGQDALTKCLRIGADTMPCAQVVGIVEDARRYELREDPAMQYYIPLGQEAGFGGSVFMIRPRSGPKEFSAMAMKTINETDAHRPDASAWPLREKIDPLLRPWKRGATVFSLAACWPAGGRAGLTASCHIRSRSDARNRRPYRVRHDAVDHPDDRATGCCPAAIGVSGRIAGRFVARPASGLWLFDTSPAMSPSSAGRSC
jgi:hypothetical protein